MPMMRRARREHEMRALFRRGVTHEAIFRALMALSPLFDVMSAILRDAAAAVSLCYYDAIHAIAYARLFSCAAIDYTTFRRILIIRRDTGCASVDATRHTIATCFQMSMNISPACRHERRYALLENIAAAAFAISLCLLLCAVSRDDGAPCAGRRH